MVVSQRVVSQSQTSRDVADGPVLDEARAVGERSTRQKRALAAVLADAEGFRSAQDLYAELRTRGDRVGLTTVYNQLRALVDSGMVDAVRAEDGELLYRRCASDAHHHHLVCRSCGKTVEIDGPDIEAWTTRVAKAKRFSDIAHTLEIVGTCSDCT